MVKSKHLLRKLDELLVKVASHTLTSKSLAAWSEEHYWLLMEGEAKEDETAAANFLREILADVTIQWECLVANLHDESSIEARAVAEFPQQLITDWLSQVEQFMKTVESSMGWLRHPA